MKLMARQRVLDLLNGVGVSTVRYLSEKLSIPKPTILHHLNKLEQDGLAYKGGQLPKRARNTCQNLAPWGEKGKTGRSVKLLKLRLRSNLPNLKAAAP